MFFVSGITGKVGGAAARQLLKEGYGVRAMVRDPQKAAEWTRQGVEVLQGDFKDAAAVAGALADVEGAYLMMPPSFAPAPGFPEERAICASLREAVGQAPPPRLVVLSSIGSEKESGVGLITATHLLEEALGDVAFPIAFVRAANFLENYLFSLRPAAETGWFDTYLNPTDRQFPMIATVDIGRQVARLLADGWSGKKIVELGSLMSPDEVAVAMGEVLGRPVKAREIPREQWTASLVAQGMPAGSTGPFEEMEDSFNSGWIAFGVPGTESVQGTTSAKEVFAQAKV